jgi:hypothetical protein
MLNYTATDQRGRQVAGDIDDQNQTRRGATLELYELGYQCAAVYDGNVLVAGIDSDTKGHRYWWVSLKLAGPRSVPARTTARGAAPVSTHAG